MSCWTSLFLFSLLFICSASLDANRTMTSSRSIYEFAQLRRMAARLAANANRTRGNSTQANTIDRLSDSDSFSRGDGISPASKSHKDQSKDIHRRFLVERLRIMIITSSVAVLVVIAIVISCISLRYMQTKHAKPTERAEQEVPLRTQRHVSSRMPFSLTPHDQRNFARKPRTSTRAV